MFFNKLTYPLVLAVLLVAGLAFIVTPATAQRVIPVLSVPDEDTGTGSTGIQVYGIRSETVSFELTVTFQDLSDPPVNTAVTGFDISDIQLYAADSSNNIIPSGATAAAIRRNTEGSVYTTTITVKGNISKVIIQVPDEAARTLPTIANNVVTPGTNTDVSDAPVTRGDGSEVEQLVVEIVRSAAPPLTLSADKFIAGNAPFTVTLTSTTAITLTRADIDVTGGFIPADGLSADTAKRVWTVTVVPGVNVQSITVQPTTNGAYIFPKGTFTVDTTGPVATITGTPPVGGGVFPITITFDEPLQTGATLLPNEITVIGGSITALFAIPNTNSYVATFTPNPGVTTVTVQVNANAVADTGGVQNAATPSPAHTFTVAATSTPSSTTSKDGTVTISEIMFATDGDRNDIQWIEISNSSKTPVALDADAGWELRIENYNDPRAPLSGTINFKNGGTVKTINPRQTVLIVSTEGRNSDRTHFDSTRVFNVYSEFAREFGMNNEHDPFLHPTQGFHIELVDGRGNLADEVGNLDGRTWTADQPAWALPSGWTADRDRTSIIRQYRNSNPQNGTQRDSWVLAENTDFSYLSRKRVTKNRRSLDTWYGSSSDYGSPGVRAGHALPVELSHFRPERTESGAIVLQWTTQSEVDNAGFNILRSQTKKGEFKVVNAQLIPGAGTTAESTTYTWTDATAKPNVVYYYQVQDVSHAGERQTLATVRLRGFISAKGKLATQWGALKQSQH